MRHGVFTLVAVVAAAMGLSEARSCAARLSASRSPPSVTSPAWSWAGAAPGMNIYIAASRGPAAERLKSVWVNRRCLGSTAGIDKNLVELRELDCLRKLIRRKSPLTGQALSEWSEPGAETADTQVLAAACTAQLYSGAASRQGAWPADS
jgi:hypothetical protein